MGGPDGAEKGVAWAGQVNGDGRMMMDVREVSLEKGSGGRLGNKKVARPAGAWVEWLGDQV